MIDGFDIMTIHSDISSFRCSLHGIGEEPPSFKSSPFFMTALIEAGLTLLSTNTAGTLPQQNIDRSVNIREADFILGTQALQTNYLQTMQAAAKAMTRQLDPISILILGLGFHPASFCLFSSK